MGLIKSLKKNLKNRTNKIFVSQLISRIEIEIGNEKSTDPRSFISRIPKKLIRETKQRQRNKEPISGFFDSTCRVTGLKDREGKIELT